MTTTTEDAADATGAATEAVTEAAIATETDEAAVVAAAAEKIKEGVRGTSCLEKDSILWRKGPWIEGDE